MTVNTYWRNSREFYTTPKDEEYLLEAIKASNLTNDYKMIILAKMASYDSARGETGHYFREAILRTLDFVGQPMRVQEIISMWGYDTWHAPTVQQVTAYMQDLLKFGLVKRFTVPTGEIFERVTKGGEVVEIEMKQVYFTLT